MPDDKRSLPKPARAAEHPEELRASLNAAIGGGHVEVSARCTPAGLVSIGVMVSFILLSVATVVHVAKARPR